MHTEITLSLSPKDAADDQQVKKAAAAMLAINPERVHSCRIIQKSTDARQQKVKINLKVRLYIDEPAPVEPPFQYHFRDVKHKTPVIIIGSGPAGLFAALRLIEFGLKPIIIERGKDVSARKRDIASIHRNLEIDPDSNYAFGEGGAGTFSDGKLYTRSNKRGDITRILNLLHLHGADDEILTDTHPHIGTNKLPLIIAGIRKTILDAGGEIFFNTRISRLVIKDQMAAGAVAQDGTIFEGAAVILASGHSARDIYQMLHQQSILLEPKGFAMGVRLEHPQALIDSIQYHSKNRGPYLPAASYSLVQQIENRGVYSFCMCPGGFVVPASTSPGEMVVNGMSPSQRNSPFANSAMVVEIRPEDLSSYQQYGVFAGLKFQEEFEKLSYANGKPFQLAPAQRMTDFINGRLSSSLPESSFIPGLHASEMNQWLPLHIRKRLQEAFILFGQKMKGFLTSEALMIGVESRTSSPVRIPRDKETFMHVQIKGLFPAGEGAGYAGGIVSSAMDGEKAAEKLCEFLGLRTVS